MRILVKLDNYYYEYSTITDNFSTCPMNLENFYNYLKENYINIKDEECEQILQELDERGTDSIYYKTVEEFLDGENISIEEINKYYC